MSNSGAFNYHQSVPDILQALAAVHPVIDTHGLDKKLQHLVLLRASQINQCAFCVKMHTREARELAFWRQLVRSLTGELTWDYGRGLVRVDTPCSQGAAGRLADAGRIELSDVVIESQNEFGSLWVISLDGAPLRTATRVLIQAMTEERPYGFRTRGNRIERLGSGPFGVRRIAATVRFKARRSAMRVSQLDENGYRKGGLPVRRAASPVVRLAEDAIYTVVQW